MGRSSTAVVTEDFEEEDFDVPSQVAILRRAVADVVILSDTQRGLSNALRDLMRLSALSEATIYSILLSDFVEESEALKEACSMALFGVQDARRWLDRLSAPKPSKARLERIRHRLHSSLALLGETLASDERAPAPVSRRPASELERLLKTRTLVSDFYGAIPWQASSPSGRCWALLVAGAELKILLKHDSVSRDLAAQTSELVSLCERLDSWQAKKSNPASTSKLYAELNRVSGVLASLSARPELKRHDTRALVELSTLLAQRGFAGCLTERVVDVLSALRGLDSTLDRLITSLPHDPPGALSSILRRVTELRARSLAS